LLKGGGGEYVQADAQQGPRFGSVEVGKDNLKRVIGPQGATIKVLAPCTVSCGRQASWVLHNQSRSIAFRHAGETPVW
jgi:hypothetical protein